jgi:hypothetical protein
MKITKPPKIGSDSLPTKPQVMSRAPTIKTSQPLMPIAKMQKGLIALLAKQANSQRVKVLMKNGLKLNYNGKGSIEVDLEKALAFNEKWEQENGATS